MPSETTARSARHKKTAHILSSDLQHISILNRILYLYGYSTIYSLNYQCALTNIRLFESDLFVMDCDMCPSYCQSIMTHIKTITPESLVLLLTSQKHPMLSANSLNVNPDYVFSKPLTADLFYAFIQRIVNPADNSNPVKPANDI